MKDADGTDYGRLFRRDDDPKAQREKSDAFVTKVFPYVVLAAVAAIALITVVRKVGGIGGFLIVVTLCFTVAFTLFGIVCAAICDRGVIGPREWIPVALFAPFLISIVLYFVGNNVYPDLLASRLFEFPVWDGIDVFVGNKRRDIVLLTLRLYILMFTSLFAAHGVISTIAAYFRRHIARVYSYIGGLKNDGTDTLGGRITIWVYKIPDVIDIEGVEMNGDYHGDEFDSKTFTSLALSIIVLGVVLSSYMFLNPIFLYRTSFSQIMLISLTLSLFFPALVIPWYSTRDTGAVVKSQARDYYLWKGLKSTLYSGFFAASVFMLLILLMVFYNEDLLRVTLTYIGYIISMVFISLLVSFVYTNNYMVGLNNGLIDQFRKE